MLRWVCTATFRIIHLDSFELSFLSSPAGPSTTHRPTREVGERAAWHDADWALCPAGGMRFGVAEGGAIG